MSAINRAGAAGTGSEIVYGNGFDDVAAFFALNSIPNYCHKITP